jgi:hypothetical protein
MTQESVSTRRQRGTIQVIAAGAGAFGGLSGAFAIGTDSRSCTPA